MRVTGVSDVIVAGAGPVGLAAALALALAGVHVTVVEKREGLSAASRASTLHPPTLEILHRLGVLAEVRERGYVAERIQYRSPDGVFAAFDMAALAGETPFPYRLHLEQSVVTPVMLRRLQSLPNASVVFGAAVASVRQDGGGIHVRTGSGEWLTGRYLLAADGARSTARDALGIGFEGFAYPDRILRVMTSDDLGEILPGIAPVTYLFNGERSVSFLRMPDCWRIIIRVPAEVPAEEAMEDGWILARLRSVLPWWPRMPGVLGKDSYGVSRHVASRMRQGRAYLIGDAAHITNTRGGMNMNCGIHDAAALAGAIVSGLREDRPELVDAASDERCRVATAMLLPRTDRSVAGGQAWSDTLRRTAATADASRAYLRTAAMMDMLDRGERHA